MVTEARALPAENDPDAIRDGLRDRRSTRSDGEATIVTRLAVSDGWTLACVETKEDDDDA